MISSQNDGMEEDGDNLDYDYPSNITEPQNNNTATLKKTVTRNVGNSHRRKIR